MKGNTKSLFNGLAIISSGVAIGHLISLAVQPLLTRLFTPEQFGIYSVFLTITSILVPLVSLSLPYLIFNTKERKLKLLITQVNNNILLAIFLLSVLFLLVLYVMGFQSYYAQLIPLCLFNAAASGSLLLSQMILVDEGRLKLRSLLHVGMIVSISLGKILSYWLSMDQHKLIMGHLAAMLLFVMVVKVFVTTDYKLNNYSFIPFEKMKEIQWDFSRYKTSSSLLNALSVSFPILFISYFFGTASAGLYGLAYTVSYAPLILLGMSLYEMSLRQLKSRRFEKRHVSINSLNVIFILIFMAGMLITFLLAMIGDELFSFIFGADWGEAGKYTAYVTLWVFASLASKPFMALATVYNLEKVNALVESLALTLRTIVLLGASLLADSPLTMILCFSILNVLISLLRVFLLNKSYKEALSV